MASTAEPTVSVIIPTYNHERFVEQAVRSVMSQSYPEIEIIVVDDGSSDHTVEVIEKTLQDFKGRCLFHRQPNHGAHHAINTGLKLAGGEFLTILNSDDYYHTDRVQRFVRTARARKSGVVFSRVRYVDESGQPLPGRHPELARYRQSLEDTELFPTRSFELLRHNFAVTSGNLFFRRSLLDQVGEFRPLRLCHDWDFLLRTLIHEEPVWLDEALMSYRLHGTNAIVRENEGNRRGNRETETVLNTYIKAAEAPCNPLAPSARNWGEYWFYFIQCFMGHTQSFSRRGGYGS
jgi:glycosyltransferase involved in cell wall biosynthesis